MPRIVLEHVTKCFDKFTKQKDKRRGHYGIIKF